MIKMRLTKFSRVFFFLLTVREQEKWKTKPATVEPGYNESPRAVKKKIATYIN